MVLLYPCTDEPTGIGMTNKQRTMTMDMNTIKAHASTTADTVKAVTTISVHGVRKDTVAKVMVGGGAVGSIVAVTMGSTLGAVAGAGVMLGGFVKGFFAGVKEGMAQVEYIPPQK